VLPPRESRAGGCLHSDKEKFRSDLKGPKSGKKSERLLKTLRKSGAFQAEYEGSIPFTRSNVFRHISKPPVSILTTRLTADLSSSVFQPSEMALSPPRNLPDSGAADVVWLKNPGKHCADFKMDDDMRAHCSGPHQRSRRATRAGFDRRPYRGRQECRWGPGQHS